MLRRDSYSNFMDNALTPSKPGLVAPVLVRGFRRFTHRLKAALSTMPLRLRRPQRTHMPGSRKRLWPEKQSSDASVQGVTGMRARAPATFRRWPAEPRKAQSDGEIFWYITQGDANNGMPSWASLPQQQRWQVITYLRSLSGKSLGSLSGTTAAAGPTARSTAQPPGPPSQLHRSPKAPFTDYRFEKPGARPPHHG